MTDQLFDHKLVITTLDPVPRKLRVTGKALAVTAGEKALIDAHDVPTLKRMLAFVMPADMPRVSDTPVEPEADD